MRRARKTINATVFAAAIRINRQLRWNIRRIVFAQNTFCRFKPHARLRIRFGFIALHPTVVDCIDLSSLKPPRRRINCTASLNCARWIVGRFSQWRRYDKYSDMCYTRLHIRTSIRAELRIVGDNQLPQLQIARTKCAGAYMQIIFPHSIKPFGQLFRKLRPGRIEICKPRH